MCEREGGDGGRIRVGEGLGLGKSSDWGRVGMRKGGGKEGWGLEKGGVGEGWGGQTTWLDRRIG